MASGKWDVTVMGAGVFGLCCAYACLAKGARVQVIDPIGPGAGSSGGLLGALAPHTPDEWNAKKQFQFESLTAAEDFWAEAQQLTGIDPGYARRGRIQSLADDRAVAQARSRIQAAEQNWHGFASWQVVGRDIVGEIAPPSPTELWVYDTLSARIAPRAACAALAAAVTAQGGAIKTNGEPLGQIIWATGTAGLDALSDDLGFLTGSAHKGQAALVQADLGTGPQVFADGIHIVPHAPGKVAVGSTSERLFDDPGSTDAGLDDLIARAGRLLPQLAGAKVLDRWASLRPRAITRSPLLGAWPGRPGHFVANGGFKIGFGMAPRVGTVMAALVQDGENLIPRGFSFEMLFERYGSEK